MKGGGLAWRCYWGSWRWRAGRCWILWLSAGCWPGLSAAGIICGPCGAIGEASGWCADSGGGLTPSSAGTLGLTARRCGRCAVPSGQLAALQPPIQRGRRSGSLSRRGRAKPARRGLGRRCVLSIRQQRLTGPLIRAVTGDERRRIGGNAAIAGSLRAGADSS